MYYNDKNKDKMEEAKRRKQDQDTKYQKGKQQEFRAMLKKHEKNAQNRLEISNQLKQQMKSSTIFNDSLQRAGTQGGTRDLQRAGTTDIYGLTEVRTRGLSVTGGRDRANYLASINTRDKDEDDDYIDFRIQAYEERLKRASDLKNQRAKESLSDNKILNSIEANQE